MTKFNCWALLCLFICSAFSPGCTSIRDRDTISPDRVPNKRQQGARNNLEQINFIALRQDPPEQYLLGPKDTLGVYIEKVTANENEPLPILTPPEGTNLPPAVGVPVTVADDGTLSLPLILGPLYVEGLTITELEREIRKAYTETQKILQLNARILVSLFKPRTYRVMVIREDIIADDMRYSSQARGKGEAFVGRENRGTAKSLELFAYQNDVLQALCETGGLPSSTAKNEVIILRGAFADAKGSNSLISQYLSSGNVQSQEYNPNITRIPLRSKPGEALPEYAQEDIVLGDGDVIVIQSREAEVFYTGGLLQGGMFPIPRDFDLDVFGAMSMAGGSVAAAAGGTSTVRGTGMGSLIPPTRLLVIRDINGYQRAINIDMKQALLDPTQRVFIQPNDLIILEYRPYEVAMNVFLSTFSLRMDLQSLWN